MSDTRHLERMDSRGGRIGVPAAERMHGGDRAGLGDKGWAETPDDLRGRPASAPPPIHENPPDQPLGRGISASDARQGEIVLRSAWRRVVFFAGLAALVLVAVVAGILR